MYQKLSKGQSLADVAVSYYDSLEALYDVAVTNNLPFDTEAGVGMSVLLPEVRLSSKARSQPIQNYENPFVKIAANQALVDIAIAEGGSVETLFDLAVTNGVGIADDLIPGKLVRKPPVVNKAVAGLFKTGFRPASNTPSGLPIAPEGIDYWYIENTFIVS